MIATEDDFDQRRYYHVPTMPQLMCCRIKDKIGKSKMFIKNILSFWMAIGGGDNLR